MKIRIVLYISTSYMKYIDYVTNVAVDKLVAVVVTRHHNNQMVPGENGI